VARKIILYCSVFTAFALDRLTKLYFVHQPDDSIIVFNKLLIFELHKNAGIIFGYYMNDLLYYVLFSIVAIILFYLLLDSHKKKDLLLLSCLLFIIIGAFSNLLDRLQYGGVVDFINVPFWSIFNLADCYIVVAVIIWLVDLFRHEKISKKS